MLEALLQASGKFLEAWRRVGCLRPGGGLRFSPEASEVLEALLQASGKLFDAWRRVGCLRPPPGLRQTV